MRNKSLVNLLQPSYSPFFVNDVFNDVFEDGIKDSYFTDFHENEEAYFTTFDVPGVTADDINIDIEDSYIKVTAERKDMFSKNSNMTKKYSYVIGIPKNVDKENISAHYENGVLNLALHKSKEESAKKKITVSTGEKPKSWTNFLNFKKKEDSGKKVENSDRTLN